jgi:hypothetical protein
MRPYIRVNRLNKDAHEPLEAKEAGVQLNFVKMPAYFGVLHTDKAPEDLLVGQNSQHGSEVIQRQNVLNHLGHDAKRHRFIELLDQITGQEIHALAVAHIVIPPARQTISRKKEYFE